MVKQSLWNTLKIDSGEVIEAESGLTLAKGDVTPKINSAAFGKYFNSRLRISSTAGKGRRTVKSKITDAMTPVKSATTSIRRDSLLSK